MENRFPKTSAQISAALNAYAEEAREQSPVGQIFKAEACQPCFQTETGQSEALRDDQTPMEIRTAKPALHYQPDAKPGNSPHLGTDRRTALLVAALGRSRAEGSRLHSGQSEAGGESWPFVSGGALQQHPERV